MTANDFNVVYSSSIIAILYGRDDDTLIASNKDYRLYANRIRIASVILSIAYRNGYVTKEGYFTATEFVSESVIS